MSPGLLHDVIFRAALLRANDYRCFYCGHTLQYRHLTVDHVMPRSASQGEVREIAKHLRSESFEIDSIQNLVPSCQPCNRSKGHDTAPLSGIVLWLREWARRVAVVEEEIALLSSARHRDELLSPIIAALREGRLQRPDLLDLIAPTALLAHDHEPLVVDLATTIEAPLVSDTGASSYAEVCDTLEWELLAAFARNLSGLFAPTEASARDGEGLGMRIAFWTDEPQNIGSCLSNGWEPFEVRLFSDLYDCSWEDLISRAVEIKYVALRRKAPKGPLALWSCPKCSSVGMEGRVAIGPDLRSLFWLRCEKCDWLGCVAGD